VHIFNAAENFLAFVFVIFRPLITEPRGEEAENFSVFPKNVKQK
jgi:hypothetical protein